MKPEEIDRLYKLNFDHYQGEVPDELWENIAGEIGPQKDRRGIIWLFVGVWFLGCTLVAGQLFYSHQPNESSVSVDEAHLIPDITEEASSPMNRPTTSQSESLSGSIYQPDIHTTSSKELLSSAFTALPDSTPSGEVHIISSLDRPLSPIIPPASRLQTVYSPSSKWFHEKKEYFEQENGITSSRLFYADVTPFLAYHHIHPNTNDEVFLFFPSISSDLSAERAGISLEAGIVQPISSRFYLKAGITAMYYRQRFTVEQTTFSGYQLVSGNDLRSGITLAPSYNQPRNQSMRLTIMDVGLNTGLGIRLGGKLSGGVIEGGIKSLFPLNERDLTFIDDETFFEKGISIALSASARLPVKLSQSSQILVGPSFTYGLNDWNFTDGPFSLRPYQLGVGITYLFQ